MMTGVDYPKPWALFWAAAAVAVGYFCVALAQRWRGWARGAASPPRAPRTRRGKVAGIWLVEVFVQPQLLQLSRLRWAAHLLVFWGFVGLSLLSALHVVAGLLTPLGIGGGLAAWLTRGDGAAAAKAWGNGAGLVLLAGLLLSLLRRVVARPDPAGEPQEADLLLVLSLLALTLTGFLLEGLRLFAAVGEPQRTAALAPWLTAIWTLHGLGGLALVAWLPRSSLLHALLAPIVIGLNARAEHARKDLYWPGTARRKATGSPQA